jgi:hypothetical protein
MVLSVQSKTQNPNFFYKKRQKNETYYFLNRFAPLSQGT